MAMIMDCCLEEPGFEYYIVLMGSIVQSIMVWPLCRNLEDLTCPMMPVSYKELDAISHWFIFGCLCHRK